METQEQRFQPEQNPPQDGSAGLLADTETGNRRTSEQAPVRQETSPAPTGDAAHGGYSSVEEHTSVILREGIWAPPTGTRQSAPESRTPSAQPEIASTTQPETRPQTPAPQTETETRPAQPAPPAAQPSDARPAQPAQPETRPQTPVAQPETQPETRPAPAQPSDARPAQPAQPETRPQTPVAQPEGPSETRPAQPAPAQPSDARPAQPAQPSEPRPSQPAQAETRPQPPAAQTESAPETRTTQPEQPATQPSEERPAQQPAQPARTGTTPTDQNGTESRTLQTEVASSGHRNEVRTQPDGRFDETLSRIRQRISDRFVNPTEGNLEAPRSSSTSTNQNDGRVNVDRRKDTDRINRNGDDLQLDLVTGRVERRNRDPLPVVEMTNLNTTSSAAQATGRVETSTSQPGNGRQLDGFTSYSTNHQNETRVDSGTTTAIETDRTRDNVIGRVQNTTPTETTYTPSITDRDRPYDDVSSRPASPVPPARQPITEDRNFYRNTPSINSGAESGNEMSLPNRWTPDQPANTQSGRITTGVLSTVEFPTTTRVNPADQQNNTARPDGTASDAPRTATRSMVLSVPAGEPRTRTETSTVNTADDPRILNDSAAPHSVPVDATRRQPNVIREPNNAEPGARNEVIREGAGTSVAPVDTDLESGHGYSRARTIPPVQSFPNIPNNRNPGTRPSTETAPRMGFSADRPNGSGISTAVNRIDMNATDFPAGTTNRGTMYRAAEGIPITPTEKKGIEYPTIGTATDVLRANTQISESLNSTQRIFAQTLGQNPGQNLELNRRPADSRFEYAPPGGVLSQMQPIKYGVESGVDLNVNRQLIPNGREVVGTMRDLSDVGARLQNAPSFEPRVNSRDLTSTIPDGTFPRRTGSMEQVGQINRVDGIDSMPNASGTPRVFDRPGQLTTPRVDTDFGTDFRTRTTGPINSLPLGQTERREGFTTPARQDFLADTTSRPMSTTLPGDNNAGRTQNLVGPQQEGTPVQDFRQSSPHSREVPAGPVNTTVPIESPTRNPVNSSEPGRGGALLPVLPADADRTSSNPSASVGTNRVETPARSEVNGAGNNPRTELTSNPERTNPATGSSTSAESRDTTRPSSYEQNGTSISGGNRAQISSTSEGRTAVPAASHEAGYTSTPAPSANNFDATVARPSTRSAVTTGDSTVAGSAVDENRNNSRAGVAPTPASASAQPSTSPRAANPGASYATGSRQLNQTGSSGSNTKTYRDTTSAPTTRTGSTTSASTTREREDEEERVRRLGRTTEDSNDNNARTGYAAPSPVEAQPTVRPPVRISGSTPGSLLRDTAPGRNDTAPVAPVADRINSILTNGKQVTSTSDGVTTRNARPANTMNDAIQGCDATRVRSINNSGTPSGRVVFDATQTGRRVVASDVNNSTPAGAGRSQGPSIVADTTNVGTNRGQGAQGTDGGTNRGQGVPGVTNGIEFNTTGNRGQGTQGIDVVNVGTGRPQGTSGIEAGISGANRGQGSQASDLIVLGNGRSQRVYGIDISTTGAKSQGQGIQGIELINVGTARPQGTDTTRGQGSQGIDQLTPGTSRTQRNPGAIGNDITSGAAGRGPGSLPGLTGLNGTNMTVAGGRVPGNIDTTIGAAGRVPGIHGIDLTNGRAPGIQGIDLTAVGAGRVPGNYGTDATNGTAGRVPGIQGSDMTGGRVSGLQGMDATAGRVPSVHGIDMTGSGRTPGAQGIDATTGRVIPGIQGIQNIQLDPTGAGRRGDVTASGVTLDPVTGKPIQDPQGRGVINPVGAVRVPNSLVGNIRTIDMQTTADGLGITNGLTGRVLVDGIRNQVGIAGRAIDARTIRLENGRVMGVNDRYMTGLEMALLMGLAGITLIRGRGNRIEGRNWSMARRGREFVIFVDGRKAPFKIGRSIGECKDLTGTFRRQLNDTVADGRKTQLSTLTMDRVSKLGTLRTGSNGTLRFERGLKTAGDALKLGGRQATLGASDLYNASRSRYPGGVELAMLMSLTGFGKMTGLENILQKPGDKLDLSSMSAADRFRLLSMTAGSLPLMAGQFGLGGTPFGGKEDGVFDDKEIDFQERLEAYLRELGLSALTSEGEDFDEQSEETEETYEEEQDEFSPPTVVFMRPKMMIGPGQTLEQIAESRYDDPDVAWLIADLNRHVMRESFLNGKRIVEFRSRQEIELPVFEDVQLFYRNRKKGQDSENLVTVIAERRIDREVVEHALNKVIGV